MWRKISPKGHDIHRSTEYIFTELFNLHTIHPKTFLEIKCGVVTSENTVKALYFVGTIFRVVPINIILLGFKGTRGPPLQM